MTVIPQQAPPVTLRSVQALRGVAALLVVLFHAAAIWRESNDGNTQYFGPWDQGYAGVDLFFVISGFIIVYIANDRQAGLRTASRFLAARMLRVYPLWWAACLLMALYFLVTYGQPASPDPAVDQSGWVTLAKSLALWPQEIFPVLTVGWTLTFEIGFYVFFGLLLAGIPPRWRMPIIGLWAAIIIIAAFLANFNFTALPDSWLDWFIHPLCLEFILGACVAAYIINLQSVRFGWVLLLTGSAAILLALAISHDASTSTFPLYRVAIFGAPSACLIAGIVILEKAGTLTVAAPLKILGDMSYSLYLFHFLILLALKRLFAMIGMPPSFWLFLVLGVGLSVAGSYVAWRLIEGPLHRASRKRMSRSAAP